MKPTVAIDTSIFVYFLEKHPTYLDKVKKLFLNIESGETQGIFASIGLIELLTGPKKLHRFEVATQYRELISHFPNLFIANLNTPAIDIASDLRAKYRITTTDAIHLACALVYDADLFITNDKALKKVEEIEVKMI